MSSDLSFGGLRQVYVSHRNHVCVEDDQCAASINRFPPFMCMGWKRPGVIKTCISNICVILVPASVCSCAY